ncbi:MAG TPA: PAS domain-containing protein [Burkholderiaceae bacterium]|nr:PAS domain-containing protein [Burkholderiaceae bacterium]
MDMTRPWLHNLAGARLGRRLAVLILLFSSIVTLVSTALQLALEYRRDVNDIAAQLDQVHASYADSLASSLWITSTRDLQLQLQGIMRLPDLQYVDVANEQGQTVAQAGKARRDDEGQVLAREFPLYYQHRERSVYIGKVRAVASLDGAWQRLRDKVVTILIAQTIKTFLVSLFILVLFQWLVGRHLKRIAAYSDLLFAGHLDQPLALERRPSAHNAHDELAQVVAALNAMRQRLAASFQQVQDSEFRWQHALEGAGHGVWDYHVPTGEVLYSKRWKEMLGYREDELPNHLDTYQRLAHPDDLRTAMRLLEANFNGSSKTYAIEQRMRCKDGSWKWVVARGMVVEQDAQGHATRIIGTHTDFSERRAAEEAMSKLLEQTEHARAELREANDSMEAQVRDRTAQLRQANAELEAFSYSVSHDLRSPLRGIAGWAQALEEDYGARLDDTARLYLARVQGEAARMGQLIDGMLELSRLGRAALNRRPLDLSALAASVAARVRDGYPERHIELDLAPGLQAWGDRALLEAVLHNLLENACKFSAMRDPARIAFGRALATDPATGQSVQAWFVRDNGAGFDMRHAHKLFGVFQRLHKASEFAGSGIGLATVQRIVQRHGGHLWASAAPDAGATFYFTLEDAP